MNSMQSPSTSTATSTGYNHWIHCNICYEAFNKKEHRFYLLACHHVTCEPCLVGQKIDNGEDVYKCPVCLKVTKGCEINNTMPPNLKELFHPQPYMDGLNNFQIMMFQSKHRERYLAHLDAMVARRVEYQRNIETLKAGAQKSYQEYVQTRAERKYLEKRARMIRQQRRSIDDNGLNKSLPSSSSGRSSSTGRVGRGSPTNSDAVTSFSNLTPTHSFLL